MSPTPTLRSLALASHTPAGHSTTDAESGLRIAGFLPAASPLRRSIASYYSTAGYSNRSSTDDPTAALPLAASHPTTATPPTYDETVQLPPSRFRITPREEEGNEQLPAYTCTLHKEALFEHKPEMSSPFERAPKRRWGKTYAVLYGTLLTLHRPRRVPFFASAVKKARGREGRPVGHVPGEMVRSYTLQLAEVGIAADYRKRHFVIRIRAQTEQFLLSCRTLEVFLEWLEALSAAVDLSPSLEERSLPRYQTLPRRRRRRRRDQDATTTTTPNTNTDTTTTTTTPAAPERNETPSPPPLPPPRSRPRAQTRLPQTDLDASASTGKWAPAQAVTAEANMRYARRCMAVLVGDAPRQSDYVIQDGKRYRLVYEKKLLEPVEAGVGGVGTDGEDQMGVMGVLPPAYEALVVAVLAAGAGGKGAVVGGKMRRGAEAAEEEDGDGEDGEEDGEEEEEEEDLRPAIVV
ncbi:uncharacterized protein LAJ45_00649 [Morchella importuna]|uniref:PH domain-containing protein n=1 Tax=Morchella conica CCBAS932 TaxID=1392247 RepID=A0A3N4L489_9PEZI|nr:uncharacterized protein LAJ45_00649 [Morchella importuna]KAH8155639.1 hypothetical protein LAJ45_00649 [Morchella importuna]RPB16329.1 hypothetical protein P167DRAFT_594420 [Morchella conica CCBAS932]